MNEEQAFPQPNYKRWVHLLGRLIGPGYLYLALGIKKLSVYNSKTLNQSIEAFKQGNHILIITFRHVAKEDAPALLVGIRKTHLRFLYGRDVLNWAGKVTSFIFPRLGFIAVQNRGTNKEGLNLLKKAVQEGNFVLSLAPEGQVTYHMYRTSPIQIGVANIASWALETGKKVTILPLVVGYRYTDDADAMIVELLERWQRTSGIQLEKSTEKEQLYSAFEASLNLVASFFHLEMPSNLSYLEKRDALCDDLLSQAEEQASLAKGEGTILDRLFRLRFHAEDLLYRANNAQRCPVSEQHLLYEQEKARLYLRNCQVVDILEYLDPSYICPPDEKGRMCESLLNLLDLLNRLEGGTINTRYSPRGKKALIYVGDELTLTEEIASMASRKKKIGMINNMVEDALSKTSEQLSNINF